MEKIKRVYNVAKEEGVWEHSFKVTKTNCIDKINGHKYESINDKDVVKYIRKQHPKFTLALWICYKCNKIKQSM